MSTFLGARQITPALVRIYQNQLYLPDQNEEFAPPLPFVEEELWLNPMFARLPVSWWAGGHSRAGLAVEDYWWFYLAPKLLEPRIYIPWEEEPTGVLSSTAFVRISQGILEAAVDPRVTGSVCFVRITQGVIEVLVKPGGNFVQFVI